VSLRSVLARIEHGPTRRCVDAERAFLAELGGDCSLPAGAHAVLGGDELWLHAFLASPDGRTMHRHDQRSRAPSVGAAVARHLRALTG